MPSLISASEAACGLQRTIITPGLGHHLMPSATRSRARARLVWAGSAGGGEREGRSVMTGWLRRPRKAGARLRNPARPAVGRIARGATGAVAAVGIMLGSWLLPPASGAQIAGTGHPRASGPRAAVEWAGFAG